MIPQKTSLSKSIQRVYDVCARNQAHAHLAYLDILLSIINFRMNKNNTKIMTERIRIKSQKKFSKIWSSNSPYCKILHGFIFKLGQSEGMFCLMICSHLKNISLCQMLRVTLSAKLCRMADITMKATGSGWYFYFKDRYNVMICNGM